MADTTTTNLLLTKPEVGASTDTWGTKINTDLDSVDAVFAAAGTGTSVGLNVGSGKTLKVAGTTDFSANLTFTGTGNRITGDFSNATVANRVAFQTSTANASTALGVIASGTGSTSSLSLYGSSDPANAAWGFVGMLAGAGDFRIGSYQSGTGTYLPMTFYTGGTESLRLSNTSKAVILAGGSTSANGTGIAFPATQSASSDANTLDDYEEGTWTPVIAPSSGSVTTQSGAGSFVKVGRLVTLYYRVTLTTVGTAAGSMQITSFPFATTSGGGSDCPASGIVRENGLTGAAYHIVIGPNSTTAILFTLLTNAAPPYTNGHVYTGSLSYVTA